MITQFFSDNEVLIRAEDLIKLKEYAVKSKKRRSRYCLHRHEKDAPQEMILAICNDSYIPPHRQIGRRKSYTVLEGALRLIIFDNSGDITHSHDLKNSSKDNSGKALQMEPFYIHFLGDNWHTVLPLSEIVVYHEIMSGVFSKTEFANWAPDQEDESKIQFMNFILEN